MFLNIICFLIIVTASYGGVLYHKSLLNKHYNTAPSRDDYDDSYYNENPASDPLYYSQQPRYSSARYVEDSAPVKYRYNNAPLPFKEPVQYETETVPIKENPTPTRYEFGYTVNDPHTGDSKTQKEVRDGDSVKGSYSVVDADGTKRTVDYTADAKHGFNAVIRTEPAKNIVPEPVYDGYGAEQTYDRPVTDAKHYVSQRIPPRNPIPVANVAAPLHNYYDKNEENYEEDQYTYPQDDRYYQPQQQRHY